MTTAASPRLADERVLVLDFGAQYAQLIARRVRENHVYCEIVRHDIAAEQVPRVSDDFVSLAGTATCPSAAVKHKKLPVYGLQFHPEVTHTPIGGTLFHNFLMSICGCSGSWRLGDFAKEAVEQMRERIGN